MWLLFFTSIFWIGMTKILISTSIVSPECQNLIGYKNVHSNLPLCSYTLLGFYDLL